MLSDPAERDGRLMAAFRRAAADMPWYRTLLSEAGVRPDEIRDVTAFARSVPILTKHNTFARFPVSELAATTSLTDLAAVLTSSGHGGQFSFGLTTRSHAAYASAFVDQSLDAAFAVKSRRTLAINCLPMGVGFGSDCMTMATTSVREDMALALVSTFGGHYDQVVLVGDPLFMKRFTDYAAAQAFDWSTRRVQVVLGEEIFGERFREHLAAGFGLDVRQPERGYIMSSFGAGELGLHLAYETPATIAVRRAACSDARIASDLLDRAPSAWSVPMVLTFNPLRTFVEVVEPDAWGYGHLTVSMLDPELPIPLLRYQTGDLARMLDGQDVAALCRRHAIVLPGELPAPMFALRGRAKEQLPNGSDVGLYKDALYADRAVAMAVSGAFRLVFAGKSCTLHVQRTLSAGSPVIDDHELVGRLLAVFAPPVRPAQVIVWNYEQFPYGMGIDYERKFAYV